MRLDGSGDFYPGQFYLIGSTSNYAEFLSSQGYGLQMWGGSVSYGTLLVDTVRLWSSGGDLLFEARDLNWYARALYVEDLPDAAISLSTVLNGNDVIYGSDYLDLIYGYNGNDRLVGYAGNDRIYGGSGNDRIYGGLGNDTFEGGAGTDVIYGGDGNDYANSLSSGNDTYYGGIGNDYFYGYTGSEKLYGDAGDDKLLGFSGNDTLTGGAGADRLYGGSGADRFDFNSVGESSRTVRDTIYDFYHSERDRVDLSTIDANSKLAGNQAFVFKGSAAFSGAAGELHFRGGYLEGDINGDRIADLQIRMSGVSSMVSSDFYL